MSEYMTEIEKIKVFIFESAAKHGFPTIVAIAMVLYFYFQMEKMEVKYTEQITKLEEKIDKALEDLSACSEDRARMTEQLKHYEDSQPKKISKRK